MLCCRIVAKTLRGRKYSAAEWSRGIRARPEQTPLGERLRKLDRPVEDFKHYRKSPSEGRGSSRFVLKPTPIDTQGRSERTSEQRKQLQLSNSSQELLHMLRVAIDVGHIDSSVFGAAAQRCGQNRWWDALQEVLNLQLSVGLPILSLDRNMYLTALFKCAKGEHGFGSVQSRQRRMIELAKNIWSAVDKKEESQTNIGLNAALRVCVAAGMPEGLDWAQQLWKHTAAKHKDTISYGSFALVLETSGFPEKVDELLAQVVLSNICWKPTHIDLGGLLNAAAERFDCDRAEALWHKLVTEHGVHPNLIAYVARAKAHLLCGRVHASSDVMDEMLKKGHSLNPHAAHIQIQSLLIAFHSSLSQSMLTRLEAALRQGEHVFNQDGTLHQRNFLKQVGIVLARIRKTPQHVILQDVLLEWKSQNSKMVSWQPHSAGSNYLP